MRSMQLRQAAIASAGLPSGGRAVAAPRRRETMARLLVGAGRGHDFAVAAGAGGDLRGDRRRRRGDEQLADPLWPPAAGLSASCRGRGDRLLVKGFGAGRGLGLREQQQVLLVVEVSVDPHPGPHAVGRSGAQRRLGALVADGAFQALVAGKGSTLGVEPVAGVLQARSNGALVATVGRLERVPRRRALDGAWGQNLVTKRVVCKGRRVCATVRRVGQDTSLLGDG